MKLRLYEIYRQRYGRSYDKSRDENYAERIYRVLGKTELDIFGGVIITLCTDTKQFTANYYETNRDLVMNDTLVYNVPLDAQTWQAAIEAALAGWQKEYRSPVD